MNIATDSKIVVLGAGGFVAGYFLKKLVENGYTNVTAISRSSPANRLPGITYHAAVDIADKRTLQPAIGDAEAVINLAGYISFLQKHRNELLKTNAEGVRNILEICQKNPRLKRLVHISSTAAFGFCKGNICETHRFEWKKYEHLLPYSHSKHVANGPVDTSDIPTNILFPSLILGPQDTRNTGKLIAYVKDKPLVFAPPGKNSVIDVRDFSEAILLVLQKAPANSNYIVTNDSHSFTEIFRIAADTLQQRPTIIRMPKWLARPLICISRTLEKTGFAIPTETLFLGFQDRVHDSSRIRSLGFVPHYRLRDTFTDYLSSRSESE